MSDVLSRINEDGTIREEKKGDKSNWLMDVLKDIVLSDMRLFNELFMQGLIKAVNTELHQKVVFGNIDFVDMLLTFGTPQALGTLTSFYSTNQVKLFEEDQFSRLLVLPLNH